MFKQSLLSAVIKDVFQSSPIRAPAQKNVLAVQSSQLHKVTGGAVVLCTALSGTPSLAQSGSDEAIQEVIVTGSLIPRSSFSQSSPIDTIDSEEISVRAPVSIADFFADLPYVTGSSFLSGRAAGSVQGNGNVNLRGLGADATLILLNSRRQSQMPTSPDNVVDINSMVPEIMIQRMEVLKDGASALYGSDAVGGVVNVLTRDDFEGVEFRTRVGNWDYSDTYNQRYELLIGGGNDRTHIVTAFSYYDQDGMFSTAGEAPQQEGITDTPGNFPNGAGRFTSPSSSPGIFSVPTRDASGALISNADGNPVYNTRVDSNCGKVLGSQAVDNTCRYYFWEDNAIQSEIDRKQVFSRLSHHFNDRLSFTGEAGYANTTSLSTWTMGDPASNLIVPGHNPGNEYRALDANNNPLYALSSGISAGYSKVIDGVKQEVFLPARDASGNVILSATPLESGSGIPFFEDVPFSGRPIGSQGALPTNNSYASGEYSATRPSVTSSDVFRLVGALNGDFNDTWSWQTSAAYSRYQLDTNETLGIAHRQNMNAALLGLGGVNCNQTAGTYGAEGCGYFNLFGNRTFVDPGDPRANSKEMVDFVLPMYMDTHESELLVLDATVTGELFDLPAGPVGVAFGIQRREETLKADYDVAKNTAQTVRDTAYYDFDNDRDTDAYYVEARVPVMDNERGGLELNLALRHEEIGSELSTTDPKVGLVFNSASGMLTLRGSYSTSFIAPSLYRLFATVGSGAGVDDCPVGYHPACTGMPNVRISQLNTPNPDLSPQSSTAWAAGIEFQPSDNLGMQLDWWTFEFEDQVLEEGTNDILLADPDGSQFGRVFRDASGQLTRVDTTYFNAASTTTSGVDFGINYSHGFSNNSLLTTTLSGTYVYEFEYKSGPGAVVVDALGQTNDGGGPPVPPNSKLRMNLNSTWVKDNHSATVRVNYIGSVDSTRVAGFSVDAFTPVDLSYHYSFESPLMSMDSLSLSIGVNNAFQTKPDIIPFPSFQPFISSMHDLRGRMWWLSLTAGF